MLAVAFLLTGSVIFAFKTADTKKEATIDYYFELSDGGNKLVRTDWVSATNDPTCPALHSDEPCRIMVPTSGTNPSVTDFDNILMSSNDFQQAASKVTYKP